MGGLRLLARQDFAQWWKTTGDLNRLRDHFYVIQRLYGEQAAAAAVDYLVLNKSLDDDFAGLSFPETADPVKYEQASASFNWAIQTVASRQSEIDRVAAKQRLFGVLDRLVTLPARDTVVLNVQKDHTAYARVPEPGACAFCLMLASRGAVYKKSTVGMVNKYHDHCRCLGIEVKRDGSDLPRINRDLERVWSNLSHDLGRAPNVADFDRHIRELKAAKRWPEVQRVKVPSYQGGEPLPKDLNRLVGHVLYGWRDRPRRGELDYPHTENIRMGIRGIASVMYLSLISRGLIKILLTRSLPHWRTQITRSQVKLNELCGKTSMEQL
ncbi:hypothetical protein FRC0522_02096 [Corynebacterium diphtheriae]|nr:hypothetical protein FRC0522_02096 [Corynebacterium diphtheriae]